MKADLGCMWPTDAPPGPYSTSTPLMLLPGTFGRAWSKTTVAFGPLSSSAAIAERRPTVVTSAQTISVRPDSPTDFEVRIRFIVMSLSVMWFGSFVARCSCCLLGAGATEPIREMRRTEARVTGGNKALIVQLRTEVLSVGIRGHLPRVAR